MPEVNERYGDVSTVSQMRAFTLSARFAAARSDFGLKSWYSFGPRTV